MRFWKFLVSSSHESLVQCMFRDEMREIALFGVHNWAAFVMSCLPQVGYEYDLASCWLHPVPIDVSAVLELSRCRLTGAHVPVHDKSCINKQSLFVVPSQYGALALKGGLNTHGQPLLLRVLCFSLMCM